MDKNITNIIKLIIKVYALKFLVIILVIVNAAQIVIISPFALIYSLIRSLVYWVTFIFNAKKIFEQNGIDNEYFKSLFKYENVNPNDGYWEKRAKKIDKIEKKAEWHKIIKRLAESDTRLSNEAINVKISKHVNSIYFLPTVFKE